MDVIKLVNEYRALERELQLINPRMEDLVRGESGVLLSLSKCKDGKLSGELGEALQLSSGRMSSILKSLENKKMIIRSYDLEDKRNVRVRLTKQGKQQAEQIDNSNRETIILLLEKLGEKDANELIRLNKRKIEILKENKK